MIFSSFVNPSKPSYYMYGPGSSGWNTEKKEPKNPVHYKSQELGIEHAIGLVVIALLIIAMIVAINLIERSYGR